MLRLRIIDLKQQNEHLVSQIHNLRGFNAINPLLYANDGEIENLKRAYAFLQEKLSTMKRTYTTRYNEMAREVGETVDKALKAALARKDVTIRTLVRETDDLQTENEELKQKIKSLEARLEESELIDAIRDAFDAGEHRSR